MEMKCSCRRLRTRAVLFTMVRFAAKTPREAIECEVDHRCRIQRQELAENEATDNGNTERPAQLRAGSSTECERYAGEESGHRCHHDRPESQQRGLIDRLRRRLSFLALRVECKVDHHDAVLLD